MSCQKISDEKTAAVQEELPKGHLLYATLFFAAGTAFDIASIVLIHLEGIQCHSNRAT